MLQFDKSDRLAWNVPQEADVFNGIVEGLTLLFVPRSAKISDERLGMLKVIIIAVNFTIANAEEQTSRRGRAEKAEIIDPLEGRADTFRIPDINNGVCHFTL